MLDMILRNPRLLEGVMGGLIRALPPQVWGAIVGELQKLSKLGDAIEGRLQAIEGRLAAYQERVEDLENICRATIPEAGPAFGELDKWKPGRAPATVAGIPLADIRRADAGTAPVMTPDQIEQQRQLARMGGGA